MKNLLNETLKCLVANGKTIADVRWVGFAGAGTFSWAVFEELADRDYDQGFGEQEVYAALVIVGEDWWLERGEYDGAEWWTFKTIPVKPDAEIKPNTILRQLPQGVTA